VRLSLIQTTVLVGLGCLGFNADLLVSAARAQSQPQEIKGIAISSLKCERKSTGVKCSFLVTDKRPGDNVMRNCRFYPNEGIRVFDGAGAEYVPSEIQFGSKVGTSPDIDLVYGVPIRAITTFSNVSSNISKFVGFSVKPYCAGRSDRDFVFRNVAIVPGSN
jgi:hypothetical protein